MPRRLRPTHTADVKRYVDQSNDNTVGEPEHALETQSAGVAIDYRPRESGLVREATGERVEEPNLAVFDGDVDVQEGDVVDIDGEGAFDVVGVDRTKDVRSGAFLTTVAELEAQ